jgi:TadE-like protein
MICVRRRAPGSKQGVERSVRRFLADASAATAVEFAIILVPFITLLGATLDLGLLFIRDALLQHRAESAARALLINNYDRSMTYQQFIDTYVCGDSDSGPQMMRLFFDCGKLVVKIDTGNSDWSNLYLGWNPTLEDRNSPIQAPPGPDQVASLRLYYPVRTGFGLFGKMSSTLLSENKDADQVLMAVVLFRTEPD